MKFKTEKEMSELFKEFLLEDININVELLEEFKGLFGIPDYILIEKNENNIDYVISIELKLNNWQRALKQAFKYKSFSNESFVVMDEASFKPDKIRLKDFTHFNIGLATFNKNKKLNILYHPKGTLPFSKYLHDKIEKELSDRHVLKNSQKDYFNPNPLSLIKTKKDLSTTFSMLSI